MAEFFPTPIDVLKRYDKRKERFGKPIIDPLKDAVPLSINRHDVPPRSGLIPRRDLERFYGKKGLKEEVAKAREATKKYADKIWPVGKDAIKRQGYSDWQARRKKHEGWRKEYYSEDPLKRLDHIVEVRRDPETGKRLKERGLAGFFQPKHKGGPYIEMKSEASKDPAKDVATKEHEARHYLYERKYPIGHRGTSSNWLNPTYTVGGRPKVSKVSFFPTENEPKASAEYPLKDSQEYWDAVSQLQSRWYAFTKANPKSFPEGPRRMTADDFRRFADPKGGFPKDDKGGVGHFKSLGPTDYNLKDVRGLIDALRIYNKENPERAKKLIDGTIEIMDQFVDTREPKFFPTENIA